MKKSLIYISLLISPFYLFPQNVFAGEYPTSFESVSYKQGWLIPNDYTTRMNPPSCKSRNTAKTEIEELAQECDKTDKCYELVSKWVEQWNQYYCSEIGMSIRTNEAGKKVAYFEEITANIEEPTLEPSPTSEKSIEENGTPTGFFATISGYWNALVQRISSFFSR